MARTRTGDSTFGTFTKVTSALMWDSFGFPTLTGQPSAGVWGRLNGQGQAMPDAFGVIRGTVLQSTIYLGICSPPPGDMISVGVYQNGVWFASPVTSVTDGTNRVIAVPGLTVGATVEIVASRQGYLTVVTAGSSVEGSSVVGVYGVSLATPVAPAKRVVIWHDSQWNGQGATDSNQSAVVALIRKNFTGARVTGLGYSGNSILGYGYTANQIGDQITNRMDGTGNNYAIIQGSTNEYNQVVGGTSGVDTLANVTTQMGAILDRIHANKAAAQVYLIGCIPIANESVNNGKGWAIPALRTNYSGLCGGGAGRAWATYVDFSTAASGLTPGNATQYIGDNVHLTTAGEVLCEAYFRSATSLY